ncbi:hypothetical protein ABFV99_13955 [Cytobacillus horneckiae]|uniref:hypothetical protein n=1 Tax=Cytobacillus horneckiae TaxID=549687 RepID=UPI0034CD94F2
MTLSKTFAEIGDLVVVNHGILGKYGYKITNDFLHIKLESIDNGFEYPKVFKNLEELDKHIYSNSETLHLVPLH